MKVKIPLRNNTPPALERFRAQIKVVSSGCWEWKGCGDGGGYGSLRVNGKRMKAHRFSYQQFVGGIPEGTFVCHHCDNPKCVNPDHLFLGDATLNSGDMVVKGRSNKGEERPAAKLTENSVRFIRENYSRGHKEYGATALAKKFEVNYYTVYAVINGSAWKHVEQQ